jgi:CRP-like cAMP-binding protein
MLAAIAAYFRSGKIGTMLYRPMEPAAEQEVLYAPTSCRPAACAQNCQFFYAPPSDNGTERPKLGIRFARNETIYARGDKALYAYKVLEGAVRLSRMYADGRRQIVSFHSSGEMFGFEFGSEYSGTAEAIGDTLVLRCPKLCVLNLAAIDPDINRLRLMMLSRSLDSAERHIAMLGHQSARQRIASFLLSIEAKVRRCDGYALDLPLGRQDIADYLGLTIETTCRALSDLKRRRIVDTPCRRQIVVRDHAALKAIAEGAAA